MHTACLELTQCYPTLFAFLPSSAKPAVTMHVFSLSPRRIVLSSFSLCFLVALFFSSPFAILFSTVVLLLGLPYPEAFSIPVFLSLSGGSVPMYKSTSSSQSKHWSLLPPFAFSCFYSSCTAIVIFLVFYWSSLQLITTLFISRDKSNAILPFSTLCCSRHAATVQKRKCPSLRIKLRLL